MLKVHVTNMKRVKLSEKDNKKAGVSDCSFLFFKWNVRSACSLFRVCILHISDIKRQNLHLVSTGDLEITQQNSKRQSGNDKITDTCFGDLGFSDMTNRNTT